MGVKQVIIIRKDLNMRKGKMVAQGAHASMAAILNLGHEVDGDRGNDYFEIPIKDVNIRDWILGAFKKVCVGIDSEREMSILYHQAKRAGLPCSFIIDSGLTEFNNVPTATACAIGPGADEDIDKITGELKLL